MGTQTSPTPWKDCALRANVLLNKMRCKLEPYKPNYVHLYPMSHFPRQSHVTHLPLKQSNNKKTRKKIKILKYIEKMKVLRLMVKVIT
jgi:hypothetical protein